MMDLTGNADVRYVALGDSYTIGEGVAPEDAWPAVLTRRLRQDGVGIDLVANPSVTGWTSSQLIEHELPVFEAAEATFTTLLIGVNDWVQNVPAAVFRGNLKVILDRVQAALPDPGKVLLLTIPDFSVTPEGSTYARGRDIAVGIAAFNDVIVETATTRRLPFVDLFPLSQELTGLEFVAEDGLHPSVAAYARWTGVIFPLAVRMLKRG